MTVITTPPGRYMGKFHDRSPLILEGDTAMNWLQAGMQADDIRAFFKPYESEHLEAYRVATLANQARNKTEAVFAPIAPPVPQAGDGPVEVGSTQDDELPGLKLF
jgi:putative SOS response-associated peptidase YedK